ncbi:DUF4153 domain-containing protein [Pedobacter sp. AW31-3R]|uniref:DUF4153 domain-containing protein n=1 Tax=Pedobacter sp. AW31-3R TaxID=3445781 RepID=UPI003FA16846
MAFPSLQSLLSSTRYVGKRFPFEILFALAGTIAASINVEVKNIEPVMENWCIRVMMVANLGVLLSMAATLYLESKGEKNSGKLIFKMVTAIAAASLIFLINPMEHQADAMRFLLLCLASHLLVAFTAFLNRGTIQGFWQFNKTLFLRITTSALYSVVLFLGLAAAIGAMNLLFNFDFKYDTFLILFIWIAGMFNTIFFLAGVPQDLPALDKDFSYPKGLKIFTQYVLIPLATVYVAILLAYEIKILIQWNLPKGYVSNLILGYAVFGILSLLLVFPIREQEENKWIKTFANSFYFLMLPLLALLFLAVGTRIFSYGITESRYFLILLAVWLLFISVYFLLSRKQNIKVIPVTLCILALLSVYGPQSAESVAILSQKRILVKQFKKHRAFSNGKLSKVKNLSKKDGERAIATVDYLVRKYDLEVLQPYIDKDLEKVKDSLKKISKNKYNHDRFDRYLFQEEKLKWMERHLGLEKFAYPGLPNIQDPENTYYRIGTQQENAVSVKGYDIIVQGIYYNNELTKSNIEQVTIKQYYQNGSLVVEINGERIRYDLKKLLSDLITNHKNAAAYKGQPDKDQLNTGPKYDYIFPRSMMSMTKNTKNFSVTYTINSLNGTIYTGADQAKTSLSQVDGILLIRKNK